MSSSKELINRYLDGILEANKTTNLTRITSPEAARVLHIEDSLIGLDELNKAPEGLYGDLGSGGGFPGVPLAIATGRETILVDSVKKKMNIVQGVIDSLDEVSCITTSSERIEDLARQYPEKFSVLTARALSRLNSLLELASPLLKQGGQLICYKAQLSGEELNEALALEKLLGMKLVSKREVILSDNESKRTILVFEKISHPRIALPRRVGLAQKQPLKP
jgi:16S rRNA (guanine527-N7)-methyltransferase